MAIPQGYGRPSLPTSEHERVLMEQAAQNRDRRLLKLEQEKKCTCPCSCGARKEKS